MQAQSGDYAVYNDGDRTELVKIRATLPDDQLEVLYCRTEYTEDVVHATIPQSALLAVLGPKPKRGTVFGVDTATVVEYYDDKGLNLIRYFDTDEHELQVYQALFSTCWGLKTQHQLYAEDVTVKLLYAAGSSRAKYEPKNRIINIYLESYSAPDNDRIKIMNALLHPVWQTLPSDFRQRWLDEYSSMRQVLFVPASRIAMVVEARAEAGAKKWKKEADDEDIETLKVWYTYCKTYKKLKPTEVDFALQGDMWRDLLPPDSLPITDTEAKITEYGMRNAEEFFCETLAYYLTVAPSAVGSMAPLCKDTLDAPLLDFEDEYFAAKMEREDSRYLPGVARDTDDDE